MAWNEIQSKRRAIDKDKHGDQVVMFKLDTLPIVVWGLKPCQQYLLWRSWRHERASGVFI